MQLNQAKPHEISENAPNSPFILEWTLKWYAISWAYNLYNPVTC